ncbi:MAG: hypothetical protein LBI18_08680, partial [Planctomycetaceae bacterium]|nr:hypothetical protein [Planctomycetaceae bacterium]
CFNQGNRGYVNAVIHYGQASDYKEARKMILEHLNNTGTQSTQPAQNSLPKPKPVSLIPKEWVYLDENGNLAKKIKRYKAKTENGSKYFVPFVYYQAQWRSKNDFKKESEWKESWQRVAGLPLNLPEIRQRTDAAVYGWKSDFKPFRLATQIAVPTQLLCSDDNLYCQAVWSPIASRTQEQNCLAAMQPPTSKELNPVLKKD